MNKPLIERSRYGSNGFTLIELTIVLIIFSFLVAVAGPRIAKGLSGLSLTTSAKKVAAALRYARSQAVNKSQPYSVIFDREHARVVIRGIPKPVAPFSDSEDQEALSVEEEADETLKPLVNEVKIVAIAEGITIQNITIGGRDVTGKTDDVPQIIFFPDGTSQGGEIVLANNRDRALMVQIDFLTGVVTVAEKTA